MEKSFLEIREITGKKNPFGLPIVNTVIETEVSSLDNAKAKLESERSRLKGKKCKVYLHVCRHGENGENLPCSYRLIEEINE